MIFVIVLIAACAVLCFIYFSEDKQKEEPKEHVLLFSVRDVSKNCFSNVLYVYENGDYEIEAPYAMEGEDFEIIASGHTDYDLDKIIQYLKTDIEADEHMMNYSITNEKTGENYYVPFTEKNELTKFLDSLNEESLFWCS